MYFGRFQNFQVNWDFPRGRKPNSFSTTSNRENKTKTLGKLQPRASAAPERRETQGQAGGRQILSDSGVCNCKDFVSAKRQKNSLPGESRTMLRLLRVA